MVTRRSRNSYMRSLRSVTLAPIGIFSRTLKAAIDFLAWVTTAFWPAISAEILGGDRRLLGIAGGLADAHVQHDLVETRNLHLVVVVELLLQRLADGLVVDLLQARRVVLRPPAALRLRASLRQPWPRPRIALPPCACLPGPCLVLALAIDDFSRALGDSAPSCRPSRTGSRRGSACRPWDRRSRCSTDGSALPW